MTIKALSAVNSTHYKWWAFIAISIGTFVSVADNGSTVVALPTIADNFDTNLPTSQWVVIGFALTVSALLLPMGRLSDIVGRKQVYIVGFIVFIASTIMTV